MDQPYVPKVNDYVIWDRGEYGRDEGWVYFYSEEYAYLFENNEWVCYDLHGDKPQIVDIPLAIVTKEAVA